MVEMVGMEALVAANLVVMVDSVVVDSVASGAVKVIESHPPLSHVTAAQAPVSSTTAPLSTSSGRWKGQWTLSVKDPRD